MSKIYFKSKKFTQKRLIYDLTNHGVFWPISKVTKIHDQGMEIQFFVLRLKICIGV